MLQANGPISTRDINAELGFERTALINLCDPLPRRLAGKPTGPISIFDFYGKGMHTVNFSGYSNITIEGKSGTNIPYRDIIPYKIPQLTVANYIVNGWTSTFDFFAESVNAVDLMQYTGRAIQLPQTQYRVGSSVETSVSSLFAWYKVPNASIKIQLDGSQVPLNFGDAYVNNDATNEFTITQDMVSSIPNKEYMTLIGFSSRSGGSVEYNVGTPFSGILNRFNPNTVLYPIYQGDPVVVRYNLNGGTIGGQSEVTVDAKMYDTITIISDVPVKTGYTFTHWEDKLKNRYNAGDQFTVTPDKLNI